MLGSYVRLTLGSYVINHANGKLRQVYVTKITLELRREVTLDLRRKLRNKTMQMRTKKYVIIT